MKKLALVCTVLLMAASTSFALDLMGPPTNGLKKGQFSAGADYSYSEMDIRLNEGKASGTFINGRISSVTMRDVRMNKLYGNLGYGIMDKWGAFLRLGAADASGSFSYGPIHESLESDMGFAIGFGTKVTIWEQSPKLKWGGLFQMSWTQCDAKMHGGFYTIPISTTLEAQLMEMQIAGGATYNVCKNVSLYGGPFFHIMDGYANTKNFVVGFPFPQTQKVSFDICQQHTVGGYLGAQVNITDNLPFYAEWQDTGCAFALAMGLTYRIP